jgi:hypothetical protein
MDNIVSYVEAMSIAYQNIKNYTYGALEPQYIYDNAVHTGQATGSPAKTILTSHAASAPRARAVKFGPCVQNITLIGQLINCIAYSI